MRVASVEGSKDMGQRTTKPLFDNLEIRQFRAFDFIKIGQVRYRTSSGKRSECRLYKEIHS